MKPRGGSRGGNLLSTYVERVAIQLQMSPRKEADGLWRGTEARQVGAFDVIGISVLAEEKGQGCPPPVL